MSERLSIKVGLYIDEVEFINELLGEYLASGRTPNQEGVNPFAIMDFLNDEVADKKRCLTCQMWCSCGHCHTPCNDGKGYKPVKPGVFLGGGN